MLTGLLRSGSVALAGEPHLFAVDRSFPAGCWCGRPRDAAVHYTERDSAGGGQVTR